MKNVSESLAGRISILEMSSLSLAEKKDFHQNYLIQNTLKVILI